MRKILTYVLIFFFSFNINAQIVDSCAFKIGTNLAGPSDWGSEWPFKNIMKYCREWGTQNICWYNGGQNPWDSNLTDSVEIDSLGYPLKLPFDWPGQDTSQVFYTVWANTADLPSGVYICLYDGQGEIDFWGDASIISQIPGRIEVNVTPGINNIMKLSIIESQLGNHIRNIRFLLPGTESNYITEPYNTSWLDKLKPFDYLRFMDWGHTNNSKLRYWEERPKTSHYTYTKNGAPYEEMIRLCNYRESDAWVCVPHLADSNYIANMAMLFRDSLNSTSRIYVEYSNEIWNWMFDQANYCNDSLDQSLPWPERLGPKIGSVMDIWTSVFAGQESRIKRVCGVQIGWLDVAVRTITSVPLNSIDLVSPTSYIGLDGDSLDYYGANLTRDKVFELARESLYNGISNIKYLYNYADTAGYDGLVYYEGGQHFTPNPFGSIQVYNDTLVACQTDTRMYSLYCEMFDSLRTITGSDTSLFMNFSFIRPTSGQYGSWGALESQFYQFEPYNISAPKYQALLDNIPDCQILTNRENISVKQEIKIYPNPCIDYVIINYSGFEEILNAKMYNSLGKIVEVFDVYYGENQLPLNKNIKSGMYFINISGKQVNFRKKILIK